MPLLETSFYSSFRKSDERALGVVTFLAKDKDGMPIVASRNLTKAFIFQEEKLPSSPLYLFSKPQLKSEFDPNAFGKFLNKHFEERVGCLHYFDAIYAGVQSIVWAEDVAGSGQA